MQNSKRVTLKSIAVLISRDGSHETDWLLFVLSPAAIPAGAPRKNHTWEIAIWLDPFGMLDPQVMVNLSLQVCVGIDLVKHDH